MASGSSPERTINVAKVSSVPCAASPLEDVAVERAEGEEVLVVLPIWPDLRKGSALWCIGIDVVEMMKVRQIVEIAERG